LLVLTAAAAPAPLVTEPPTPEPPALAVAEEPAAAEAFERSSLSPSDICASPK
jgi:hypothetical protein